MSPQPYIPGARPLDGTPRRLRLLPPLAPRRLPDGYPPRKLLALRERYLDGMRDGTVPEAYARSVLAEIAAALGTDKGVAA